MDETIHEVSLEYHQPVVSPLFPDAYFYLDCVDENRDHIRYKDPIQCSAARIVAALREEFGDFDTFHVRRGDFQVSFYCI